MGYNPEVELSKAIDTDTQFRRLRESILLNYRTTDMLTLRLSLDTLYKHGYVRGAMDTMKHTLGDSNGHTPNRT